MSGFLNEKYTMKSCRCECFVDTSHNSDGSVNSALRIRALPADTLLFAYMPQEGLVRISEKTGAVESKNLLGELMAIRDGDEQGVMSFFKENGFLFPISSESLETFSFNDVFAVLRRIRETLNTMSLLYEPRKQYKKIMSTICWLTLSPRIQIKSLDEDKDSFSTCLHPYKKYMNFVVDGKYDTFNLDPYAGDDIAVPDTIYTPESSVSLNEMESKALLGSSGDYTNGLSSYTASIIFLNERGELETDKRLIDYFYHLTREIGDITAVKSEKTEVEFSCDDAEVTERFSTVLRQATLDVAKIIIKEELDYAINAIYPSYNIETMTGSWTIPDLYSALLFSIFYMKPDLELYRKCENPNCGRYFLVNTTNNRRKYCCVECSNAMQQRKLRQRRKKASTEVDAGI